MELLKNNSIPLTPYFKKISKPVLLIFLYSLFIIQYHYNFNIIKLKKCGTYSSVNTSSVVEWCRLALLAL